MRLKLNCWEFKRCGREPGGTRAGELGVCPAAEHTPAHGLNGGINGGRICWAVAGTLCDGVVQGTFAYKRISCMTCDVYITVKEEEGFDQFLLFMPRQ